MDIFIELHLFTYLYFSLFLHLRSFLGVQVTAGRDSKSLVFESFSRFSQKLSLCFSTRQPIPKVGWITCEWAVDFMTPTWLKRLCVVLVALLNLSFLALAVVENFLDKNFMVKKHERSSTNAFESFAGSISYFLLSRQRNISFWGLNFMLKDRIRTFFSFEAALPKKVVGKLIYVVTVGS